MNAFTLALSTEVAQARTALLRAQRHHDDSAAEDAQNRLRDLADLARRARDGLPRTGATGTA